MDRELKARLDAQDQRLDEIEDAIASLADAFRQAVPVIETASHRADVQAEAQRVAVLHNHSANRSRRRFG